MCGLVAAHTLACAGTRVTLVEASDRVGGQVRSAALSDAPATSGNATGSAEGEQTAGEAAVPEPDVIELGTGRRLPVEPTDPRSAGLRPPVVELGAEAVPLRAPGVTALIEELGLARSMTHPRSGRSLLSSRRGAVPMPDGVTPTGPTRLLPTVRSQILSPRGLLRAAAEPLTGRRHVAGDISVGEFIESRFGPQVARAVVDPLLGAIHAADIHRFSLAAAAPALVESAAEGNSLLLDTLARQARRTAGRVRGMPVRGYRRMSQIMGLMEDDPERPASLPPLASWPGGTETLPNRLAASVRTHGRVLLGTRATSLAPPTVDHETGTTTWRVGIEGDGADRDGLDGDAARELSADAVILATGSAASAALLADVSPEATAILSELRAVSVATVILDLPATGSPVDHPIARAASWFVGSAWSPLIRQVTNLSLKWPRTLGQERLVLRVGAGRDGGRPVDGMDDDELVSAVVDELGRLGLPVAQMNPRTLVGRFPHAMPQPAPGHRDRMEYLAAAVSEVPGLALGGCASDGAGVGTAIVAGRRLARQISAFLSRDTRDRDERGGIL